MFYKKTYNILIVGKIRKKVKDLHVCSSFQSTEALPLCKIETIHGCKGMSLDAVLFMSAYQKNIKGFIINATKENEWEKIISLSKKYTFVQAAIGIHPWFIETASPDWEEKMSLMLQNNPSLMIGEIGLDGLKDNIKKQEEIFLTSLCLAQKFKRSVHIHAVKSWDKILSHLKEFSDVTYCNQDIYPSNQLIQLVDNFTLPLQQIEKNFYNFIKKSEN